jgi:YVTN family beta-propeller protein
MDEEQFGPYHLQALLGRGGMGEVFRAFDAEHERVVALKRLAPHLADDPDFRTRFRQEARLAARLRNPHIITIHRFGELDGHLFIDMRFVDGFDVADLVKAVGPLAPQRAVTLVEQVASALDTAHAAKLVHRDVKPSNLLIDREISEQLGDFAYLADFGITRPSSTARSYSLTRTGALLGSLDYMAPEQFEGVVDKRADIYSLTCVLFELLTAQKPYQAAGLPALMHAHLNVAPPELSALRPELGTAFDEVVARGMAKRRDERFDSAGELAAAARDALSAAEPTGAAVPPRTRVDREAEYAHVARCKQRGPVDLPGRHVFRHTIAATTLGGSAGTGADPAPPREPEAPAPETVATTATAVDGPTPPADPGHLDDDAGPAQAQAQAQEEPPDAAADDRPTNPDAGHATTTSARTWAFTRPDPRPHPAPGATARAVPRRAVLPALLVIAVLAVVAVVVVVVVVDRSLRTQDEGSNRTAADATVSASPEPGAVAPPVPASTPDPTLRAVIPVGTAPQGLAVSPDGRQVVVANIGSRTVSISDGSAAPPVDVPVPGTPRYVTFAPDGRRAYVSMYTGDGADSAVAVIDVASRSVAAVAPSGPQPYALAAAPSGDVLVPNHGSSSVSVLDGETLQIVGSVQVEPNPHGVAFSPTGEHAYTANHESDSVSVIDVASRAVVETVDVGRSPHSVAMSPDGTLLAVANYLEATITFIDTATNLVTATVPAGPTPQHLTFAADGAHVYVVNEEAGLISSIDVASRSVVSTVPVGRSPRFVVASPDGSAVYVSNSDDGTVSVLNTS